jgi:long-chain fatty acid transport protein
MLFRAVRTAIGATSLVMSLAAPARAQSDYEVTAALQFNLSNPGARSLALAGALTGRGDDATGAWTNPGGLTTLTKREVSVEVRTFDYTNTFTSAGHALGPPSAIGIDRVEGLVSGTSHDRANAISFASMVVPTNRWALALYRSEAANFTTSIDTEGAYFTPAVGQVGRLRPVRGALEVDVVNYGVCGAYQFNDQISLAWVCRCTPSESSRVPSASAPRVRPRSQLSAAHSARRSARPRTSSTWKHRPARGQFLLQVGLHARWA